MLLLLLSLYTSPLHTQSLSRTTIADAMETTGLSEFEEEFDYDELIDIPTKSI